MKNAGKEEEGQPVCANGLAFYFFSQLGLTGYRSYELKTHQSP